MTAVRDALVFVAIGGGMTWLLIVAANKVAGWFESRRYVPVPEPVSFVTINPKPRQVRDDRHVMVNGTDVEGAYLSARRSIVEHPLFGDRPFDPAKAFESYLKHPSQP